MREEQFEKIKVLMAETAKLRDENNKLLKYINGLLIFNLILAVARLFFL